MFVSPNTTKNILTWRTVPWSHVSWLSSPTSEITHSWRRRCSCSCPTRLSSPRRPQKWPVRIVFKVNQTRGHSLMCLGWHGYLSGYKCLILRQSYGEVFARLLTSRWHTASFVHVCHGSIYALARRTNWFDFANIFSTEAGEEMEKRKMRNRSNNSRHLGNFLDTCDPT